MYSADLMLKVPYNPEIFMSCWFQTQFQATEQTINLTVYLELWTMKLLWNKTDIYHGLNLPSFFLWISRFNCLYVYTPYFSFICQVWCSFQTHQDLEITLLFSDFPEICQISDAKFLYHRLPKIKQTPTSKPKWVKMLPTVCVTWT